jgi:thiamine biosynthesis lipoprotein
VSGPLRVRPAAAGALSLHRVEDHFVGRFAAMASPCEVLVDTDQRAVAAAALRAAADEAWRIERKFSRYRDDNILHRIHHAGGQPVEVDEETAHLLDYAVTCHEMSDGRFDITSGVLRRVWRFDGGEHVPDEGAVREVLRLVGWRHVTWRDRTLTLPAGMEIDFGGIGKEYAVDRAAALIGAGTSAACVVNFGGDLYVSGPRRGERPWGVGLDDPQRPGEAALLRLELERGGLATSGDARRYVTWNGRRLGHILDPRTGWPVPDAPRSVTVLATTCVEAGTLSTLAYLQGAGARAFLAAQGVQFWVV